MIVSPVWPVVYPCNMVISGQGTVIGKSYTGNGLYLHTTAKLLSYSASIQEIQVRHCTSKAGSSAAMLPKTSHHISDTAKLVPTDTLVTLGCRSLNIRMVRARSRFPGLRVTCIWDPIAWPLIVKVVGNVPATTAPMMAVYEPRGAPAQKQVGLYDAWLERSLSIARNRQVTEFIHAGLQGMILADDPISRLKCTPHFNTFVSGFGLYQLHSCQTVCKCFQSRKPTACSMKV